MLIWILALVLFASLGFIGYSLGVIRVAFTFVGLLAAAVLSWPLGRFMNSVVGLVGVKNPVLVWLLGPVVVFLIILIVFKVIGMIVHRKVDVYYKYKAGDLKMGLWNRLSARLGLCVGLANAAVYLILISTIIYLLSYSTTQMVTGDTSPWAIKLLNTAGKNVQDNGLDKVAVAIDPLPETYYQAVDILGLIYHNDLLEGRLTRYPAFLAMGETPEFQDIGKDKEFNELRQRQAPIGDILNHPRAQAIVNNPDMLNKIWGIVAPNLKDIHDYLLTGKSAKYDQEPILGRWTFSLSRAIYQFKQGKPNVGSIEMQRVRHAMTLMYRKTTLVAAPVPEKQAYLKNMGKLRAPAKPNQLPTEVDLETFTGTWDGDNGKYEFNFPNRKKKMEASIEGDIMTISGENYPMVFVRE